MRTVINLVLLALVAVLIWVLYSSIAEPIAFKTELEKRKNTVAERLQEARTAQEIYRDVTGEFAGNWDSLEHVLRTGKLMNISVFGDPDDPSNQDAIRRDTSYYPAIDDVKEKGINLDSIRYIPYTEGKEFDIKADTVTYQSTNVHVVQVGTRLGEFMGKYDDKRYARYDDSYNPNFKFKFGDLNSPSLSGTWD